MITILSIQDCVPFSSFGTEPLFYGFLWVMLYRRKYSNKQSGGVGPEHRGFCLVGDPF